MYQQMPPDQQAYAIPGTAITPEPRARPCFPGGDRSPENGIRGYYEECCCGMRPGTGPNVPPHWFDGGHGWATAHFFDVQPFDLQQQLPGVHQCKYCTYVAEGEECCSKSICWCPLNKAPAKMMSHLVSMHGIAPPHPFDAGWATAHFYDVQPFDIKQQLPGIHQCKYCEFVAEGEDYCRKSICWCPLGRAPGKMVSHLTGMHGIAPPPMRAWATECTDTEGCCDAIFCFQCQASRQINAAHGLVNQFNAFWCLYFSFAYQSHRNHDGRTTHHGCHCLAAYLTRNAVKTLNRIDEDCCTTLLMAFCCPVCSIAQTYREYAAAGVWPGGVCNGDAPAAIMMNNPPPMYAPVMGGGAPPGSLYGTQDGYGKIP